MSDGSSLVAYEERIDYLRSMAHRPDANVSCIDTSFSFCPVPRVVAELGSWISDADVSVGEVLQVVPADDIGLLMGALSGARRTGIGTAQIRLPESPVDDEGAEPVDLCIVDMTEELGVYVCVVGELGHAERLREQTAEPLLRPRRLVQYRDETACFVRIDPLTKVLLGWTDEDLLGSSALDFIHPDDHDRGILSWMEMLAGRSGVRYRLRFKTAADEWRWFEISNTNRLNDPDAGYVETEMVDVDDEMSALARVRTGELQFKTLTESLPVGVIQVGAEANLVYVNEWIRQRAGFEVDEQSDHDDLEPVHAADRDALRCAFLAAVEEGTQTDLDVRLCDAGGDAEYLCRVRVRPLRAEDEIYGAIASVEDVTESASLQSRLRLQASTDHLTGLPNRAALSDGVKHLIDAATGHDNEMSVAVLFIDLDGFKLVNDGLGHEAGDDLLVEVGRRLSSTLRPDDFIARVGGDEFVIVCPWTRDLQDAAQLAERILERLQQPFVTADTATSVGASIGIAMHDGTPTTADVLIGNADLAMYEAKHSGGGRWRPYGEQLRSSVTQRFELERTIRSAIRDHEFSLVLQPIRELDTGHAVAAECLVRWNHPTRGLVAPAQFIPVAEQSDLIVELGRWILDDACRIGARLVSEGLVDFRIAVNLSGRQLARPAFHDELLEIVDRRGLSLDPPRVWAGGCGRVHQKGLLSWDACDVQSHVHRKHGRHFL